VLPPHSRLLPLTPAERAAVVKGSPLAGHYEQLVDRESAYEKLKGRAEEQAATPGTAPRPGGRAPPTAAESAGKVIGQMAQSAARAAGTQIGRQIMRGILGSLFGGRR
jgi:hypothetical protein